MSKCLSPATAALCVLTCACSHTHTVSTQDGTVSIDSKGAGAAAVHITGKDGSSVEMNTGKAITDYPGDVPLYQGKSAFDIKSEKNHARSVSVQTSDPAEKISDFYKAQLSTSGWKTESTVNTPQMTMYVATKEKRKLVVTINSDGKMQTVSQVFEDQ